MDEKKLLQVLAEQKEEIIANHNSWVSRYEESLFELNSSLAQVVIGVRRSGKSTICHKVLQDHGINYAYANLDDDRLMSLTVDDLNTLLLCLYQLYGTDIQYIYQIYNLMQFPYFLQTYFCQYIKMRFLQKNLSVQ